MKIITRVYDHPDVVLLVGRLQGEYVQIHGSPDEGPIEAGQFSPPRGVFAVGYQEGVPVAMGGWRFRDDGRAEIKRMYVVDEWRGRGYSRSILAWLEGSAAAFDASVMVLETSQRQPAAIGLYRSFGYTDIPAFGHYADDPLTVTLGRPLSSRPRTLRPGVVP